jgi:signal transduction histidine kinase
MKFFSLKNTLFWRLSLMFLLLFILLGTAYIVITVIAARRFYDETSQKLNAHVADHMLEEVKPFVNGKVDEEALGTLMHSMMAVNPSLEVYLLNPEGEILTYVVLKKKVKLKAVSVEPIQTFLANKGKAYIPGDDPRNPGNQTIFSAAEVKENGKLLGYAYLVLASEEYENTSSALLGSYWLRIGTNAFAITLIAAFILGLIVIALLTRHIRVIAETVSRFEAGDLHARIPEKSSKGELAQLSRTFNKMADTLLTNIDELKKVDSLRRELIANVSHDLRNPLAVIHGYIETLMIKDDELSSEDRKEFLKIILSSSDKLKGLVVDLFELSKLEAGQIEANKEPFFINELVYDTSRKYQLLAGQKDIQLRYQIAESLPMVYADISMIDRVIQNLMDNAIKYTPEKGWINLQVERVNGSVKVAFQNSGEGITEKDIPFIFDRYYKINNTASGIKGTGLGLAIVKKILDIHNIAVGVKSIPNEITSFSFDIPVVDN